MLSVTEIMLFRFYTNFKEIKIIHTGGFLVDFDVITKSRLFCRHMRVALGTRLEALNQDGGQVCKQCNSQGNIARSG